LSLQLGYVVMAVGESCMSAETVKYLGRYISRRDLPLDLQGPARALPMS
jgi:hypothetical protein